MMWIVASSSTHDILLDVDLRLLHDHGLLWLRVATDHWLLHRLSHHRLLLVHWLHWLLSVDWLCLHDWLCDRNIAVLHKWLLIVHLISNY